MLVGFFTMVTPVALGLSPAAAVFGVVVGTLVIGLSLSSTGAEAEGRRTMTIATHHALDYGLVTGLLGAALTLGIAGDRPAAVVFAVAALAQLALNLATRYSQR
jgi:hypothetical protein